MRSPVVPLLAVIVLWVIGCHPAHADDLDDALTCGIKAYADTQPPAGEWAKQLVNELKADADLNQTIPLSGLKFWMIGAQRQDGDPNRPERMGTLAHAMATCSAVLPDQPITTGYVLGKAEQQLLEMYPPPPAIDPKSLIEWQKHRESVALFRARREAAFEVVTQEFDHWPVEQQKEIYIAALELLKSEIE